MVIAVRGDRLNDEPFSAMSKVDDFGEAPRKRVTGMESLMQLAHALAGDDEEAA
jgi:hypothetical protein